MVTIDFGMTVDLHLLVYLIHLFIYFCEDTAMFCAKGQEKG